MNVAFLLLDGEVTGGQVVAHQLIRGLLDAGHAALAVVPEDGPMVERLQSDGIEVSHLRLDRTFRLDQAIALARKLRAGRVDLLDTHTLFVGNQLAREACLITGIPLVQHGHIEERFSGAPVAARAQRTIERVTIRIPRAFVAVSSRVRESLIALGAPESRVHVVHNGVPLESTTEPPGRPTLRVVCVARLAHVKGQDALVEALAVAGDGIHLELVGADLEGGRFAGELEQLIADRGLAGRVSISGYRADVRAAIDAADVVVLPSRDEGLPLVALEAMARSRPVVATSVGGLPELIRDGDTGLLVEPGAVEALAAALVRLRDDPALRLRLASAGRQVVEDKFTVEAMRDRTIALYESVVG